MFLAESSRTFAKPQAILVSVPTRYAAVIFQKVNLDLCAWLCHQPREPYNCRDFTLEPNDFSLTELLH